MRSGAFGMHGIFPCPLYQVPQAPKKEEEAKWVAAAAHFASSSPCARVAGANPR